jgi:4-amino-4-deoxy-L-arabinose transferase-like glycosyltransferase
LFITFLKGAVWAATVPIFQTPDEQTHYTSVQHYAEPKDYKPLNYNFSRKNVDLYDINTQNLSPELKKTLENTQFESIRFHPDAKMAFSSDSFWGSGEKEIQKNRPSRFVDSYPAWFTSYSPMYYSACAFLENAFASGSIVDRVFVERMLSVFLTTLTILFAYFIFREIKFNKTEAVLAAGFVSFQPMFTFIGSSINVDAMLFFGFSIFLLGAVRVLNQKNFFASLLLLASGAAISISSKPTGYFLIPATILLGIFYAVQKREAFFNLSQKKRVITLSLTGLFLVFTWSFLWKIIMRYFSSLRPLPFYHEYILFQVGFSDLLNKSRFYWGDFGWLDTPIGDWHIYLIWTVLFFSLIGAVWIIAKKRENFVYVLFFAFIVAGFGLMIHLVNSSQIPINNVRDMSHSINIQGRYFFPVIIAKMALIIFGLSAVFPSIPRKKIIYALFIGMVALNLIGLFNYVIPRYYL